MRACDLLHDRQSHARARYVPGARTAIEPFYDPRPFRLWNRRARVPDADLDDTVALRLQLDGRRRRRVLQGVVEQLTQCELEQAAIGINGHGNADVFDELMHVEPMLEPPQRRVDDRSQIVALAMYGEVAGVDSQHLDRVGDEALEPIEILVEDRR